MKTPPPIQKVRTMVSSIEPQFEAMSVHHQGVHTWNAIEPIITARNIETIILFILKMSINLVQLVLKYIMTRAKKMNFNKFILRPLDA